jgi:DNA-binding NtrC family response regulator
MPVQPTVLVVDDNNDLLTTFSMILKRRGFYVDTAPNGISAVDKFKEHGYDVTLMDIVMPEMNGVEAFRKIRELDPDATVILMTAYSEEEMIRTARNEGAHSVIHKPIRIDQLIELIKSAADCEPILIVDDDEDMRETLTKALEMNGYPVVSAGTGCEAIHLAKEKTCQIAFIDIKLPDIDGLETFLRLKEINPGIFTVMMTGFRNEVKDALEKAQASQVVTCLYKPFAPSEVADIVRKISKKAPKAGR